MEKRIKGLPLLILVLLVTFAGSAIAGGTEVTALEKAVQAAWLKNAQLTTETLEDGTVIPNVSQANAIALELAEVVIDLDFARNKYQFLEERQKVLKPAAEQADIDFKMGKIKAKTRDSIKQEVVKNDFDLNLYKMQIDNGEKSFQRLTGTTMPANFDSAGSYLIVDAGKLSLPPSVTEDKAAALEKKLNEAITAYSKLGTLITAYIDAAERLAETENAFKTGKAGNAELEAAKLGKEKTRIDVFEGKAAYSKILYQLDCGLQGYISRDVKKVSNPIFQQDILKDNPKDTPKEEEGVAS